MKFLWDRFGRVCGSVESPDFARLVGSGQVVHRVRVMLHLTCGFSTGGKIKEEYLSSLNDISNVKRQCRSRLAPQRAEKGREGSVQS